MKHNKKKISRMIDELVTFFFGVGGKQMQISLEETSASYIIDFKSDFAPDQKAQLEHLDRIFSSARTDELEENYWELAGLGDMCEDSELYMLGMMTDEAEIQIEKASAHLVLTRYKA